MKTTTTSFLGAVVVAMMAGCGGSDSTSPEPVGSGGAGSGGSAQAGSGGNSTAGKGGSSQAGSGGSPQAGQGGSSAGSGGSAGSQAGGSQAGQGGEGQGGQGQGGQGQGGQSGGSGQGGSTAGGQAGQAGGAGGGGLDTITAPAVELVTWQGKLGQGFQAPAIVVKFPKQPASPKLPLVVFAHGFQLGVNDYNQTLEHIAKFGYVVASVDFAGNFLDQDHHAPVDSMKQAIELLTTKPPAEVGALVDADKIASMGHSLGGKGAIWAALELPEIKALVALDPVDDDPSPFPNPSPKRPSLAPEKMGALKVPALYFGAQLSVQGGQACAPKGSNACGFAASTPSGLFSRHVTLEQFGHMQFLDNPSCFTCSACTAGPDPSPGKTFVRAAAVAFLESQLRGSADHAALLDSYISVAQGKNSAFDAAEQKAFCSP